MKHEFTVQFEREVSDDLEYAKALRPDCAPIVQLAAQLCAELDENPELRGTYTVSTTTAHGNRETHYVCFAHNDLDDRVIARVNFRQILQETYDRYGMAGSFRILPDMA